jgi:hypothetical protein
VTFHPELLQDNYVLERANWHAVTSCLKVLLSAAPLLPEAVLHERIEAELQRLAQHSTRALVVASRVGHGGQAGCVTGHQNGCACNVRVSGSETD